MLQKKKEEEKRRTSGRRNKKKKPDHHIINTFINISYVLLLSLMILLLGLVVHIALGNMMDQPVVKVLHAISLGYIDVVESIFLRIHLQWSSFIVMNVKKLLNSLLHGFFRISNQKGYSLLHGE